MWPSHLLNIVAVNLLAAHDDICERLTRKLVYLDLYH